MSKLNQINWMYPEKRKRSLSTLPRVTVTSKPFKSGPTLKTAPYWRFSVNRAFIDKYYPGDPKIKKISLYIGGQGVIMDCKPSKDQPCWVFGATHYFTDENLVSSIMRHFRISQKPKEITTFHLHVKPFGKFDEKPLHQLTYIDGENPDTTQLSGVKKQLENDEDFPEPDKEKKSTIKIEG